MKSVREVFSTFAINLSGDDDNDGVESNARDSVICSLFWNISTGLNAYRSTMNNVLLRYCHLAEE